MTQRIGTVELYNPYLAADIYDGLVQSVFSEEHEEERRHRIEKETCPVCAGVLVYDQRQATMICEGRYIKMWVSNERCVARHTPSCGYVDAHQISAAPSFAHSYQWSRSGYNPMNHFLEWIKRLNGDELTHIPAGLIERIRHEIDRRYLSLAEVDTEWILDIMRYITTYDYYDCRSYFENVYKIRQMVTGRRVEVISHEQKEAFKLMFAAYVSAFNQLTPQEKNGRKSIQEYSYIIYIFALIRGYDNILPHLPLIQGSEVLYEYNALMKILCEKIGWPTVFLSPSSIHRI